jgi:hypothetical protein
MRCASLLAFGLTRLWLSCVSPFPLPPSTRSLAKSNLGVTGVSYMVKVGGRVGPGGEDLLLRLTVWAPCGPHWGGWADGPDVDGLPQPEHQLRRPELPRQPFRRLAEEPGRCRGR